jgi:type I restriction enzyme S subunit
MSHDATEWDLVPLDKFGDIVTGGTPSRTNPSYWNGSVPWVTPTEITTLSDKFLRETRDCITAEGLAASAAKLLPVGSVLVTTRATLGAAAIAAIPVATNQGFKSIVPNATTHSTFAYHCVTTLRSAMVRLATGTTFPEISKADFARIRAYRPEYAEQVRIAAVLDAVDEVIAITKRVIVKLQRVRTGLVHDLLTRGLDDNNHLRDPVVHPELFQATTVGRIPKEWQCTEFDAVLQDIETGKSPDYPDVPAPPGEWGVLKVSAIRQGGFRPDQNKWVTRPEHQNALHEVHAGELLISRSNTYELVGLACVVGDVPPRLMLSDKTLRLRLKANRGLNPFFNLLLQSRACRSQIEVNATGTSGSMKNISQDVIRALQLAYPKVDEQQRILNALAPIEEEVAGFQSELTKLVALKSGLATDLLTGNVRATSAVLDDSDDE